MQLTFESLDELQTFVAWVNGACAPAPVTVDCASDFPAIAPQHLMTIESTGAQNAAARPSPEETEVDAAEVSPKRKRRTKAEMEAARAAETANPTRAEDSLPSEISTRGSEAGNESSALESVASASAARTEVVDKDDSAEFIKTRLTERPEISQVEHLNLARTFIGKHGVEKYNASFPLAGLTPNVMSYSPADCATHAAALDFLSLE